MTDETLIKKIMEIFLPGGNHNKRRTLAFSVVYRKLFGSPMRPDSEQRLLRLMAELVDNDLLIQQPNFGVGEQPYTPP